MADDVSSPLLDSQKDALALRRLAELEELIDVPAERGGGLFSDWEKGFVRDVRRQYNELQTFTAKQRSKIDEVWHGADLRKRPEIDDKPANLFSKLSPAKQAEQRARAARVKLPWET